MRACERPPADPRLVRPCSQGNRKVSGYLRGFDIFLNLVIDDAREETTSDKIACGTVVRTVPAPSVTTPADPS